MDFTADEDRLAEHRGAARQWVQTNLPELPDWIEHQRVTGDHHSPELHRRLADAGWHAAGWPEEYGGNDVDPALASAVLQEVAGSGVHQDGWSSTYMIIRTICDVGSEELKRDIIPRALRGEIVLVLGYSEPDAGSDVAAVKTRALHDGDAWVVNGQKMFTSTAHLATHVFLLTRTNVEVPKHRGLTMFVADLADPGVEIHPIHTLGGQRTNATYYTDVRVPDRRRVGPIDGGWGVMRVALRYERSDTPEHGASTGGLSSPSLLRAVADWAKGITRDDGTRPWDDPAVRERLARAAIDNEIARLLESRAAWLEKRGDTTGIGGAASKLFNTEASQHHAWDLLDIIGEGAVLKRESGNAPLDARVEEMFRYGVVTTLYGGSSEIMREIIAERQLGLPRGRPR